MRKCTLVLNYGSNMRGIHRDAVNDLRGRGWEPEATALIALERDSEVGVEWPMFTVDQRGRVIDPANAELLYSHETPIVLILNGGTTVQQWCMHGMYHSASRDVDYPGKMLVLMVPPGGPAVEMGSINWPK